MKQSTMLLADSGSTKTDWLLLDASQQTLARVQTSGINPFMQSSEEIAETLHKAHTELAVWNTPGHIRFYGAGCRDEQCQRMEELLRSEWPEAEGIEVGSDLLGAAMSLFANFTGRQPDSSAPNDVASLPSPLHATTEDGIACILGTGSNSGLFISGRIVRNVSPLGYILGDEGSGSVLGRRLLGDLLKHQLPQALEEDFTAQYHLSASEVLQRVYREPFANRFLASFAPFIHRHRAVPEVHALLLDEFSRFFLRNVAQYERPDLPVSFVGSIAHYFAEELTLAAQATGFRIGRIRRTPL